MGLVAIVASGLLGMASPQHISPPAPTKPATAEPQPSGQ
jgi:hypothetical protein